MRKTGLCGIAAIAGAALAWPAAADFMVDLGSGPLAGSAVRYVDVEQNAFMVSFEIAFDFVPGGGAEWASDMGFWVDDPDGSTSVQIGGYNVLFADTQGPPWSFDGGGSAAAGPYADAQPLIHSGNGVWRFSIGNGWTGGAAATEYNNVMVTAITGEAGACGESNESCTVPHPTPGCNLANCCVQVCAFEAACCDIEWDEFCVSVAVDLCGLYVYNCPTGGPSNNCPSGATPIADGETLPFDTTNADPVAPESDCEGDSSLGPDVWFSYTATASGTVNFSGCDQTDYDQKMRAYNAGDGNIDYNTLADRLIVCGDDTCGVGGGPTQLNVAVENGTVYLFAVGGWQFAAGSGTVTLNFIPELSCGDPNAGSCCEPSPLGLGYCDDADCCATVCALDAFCCDTAWDNVCANMAFTECSPLCGEPIPPYECTSPGANPYASTPAFAGTGGIACAGGGITTPNAYAVVFSQNDLGAAYSFSCVNFGLDNSAEYLEGVVGVWIDPTGGDPMIGELVAVDSAPVGLYTGQDQQVTVLFPTGSLCVELTGSETLVVTLSIPQASTGFCTFAGDTTGATTYIQSNNCGLADFVTLDSIGFTANKWWVELSGDFGCEDGIIGDLNQDGFVNGADLSILLSAWGTADPVADLNGDGTVNGADLSIQLSNWTG